VTALDWFNGRRTPYADPLLTGTLAGLNLGTTPAMIYRALIEATLYGSKAILEHYINEKLVIDSIIAVGGISSKSPFIMQMCADILAVPIKVAACSQACALGAAMAAAVSAGVYADCEEAARAMGAGFSKVYEPRREFTRMYEKIYLRYLELGKSIERN
jgi:L-ribulokinase